MNPDRSVAFRLYHAGDQDASQLVGILLEGSPLVCGHDLTLHGEIEPVRCFVQFLTSSIELADEFGG
jgi:hypothetical protein